MEKASHFLSTVFSYESIAAHAILPSTTLVFVKEPPEPYCVCKNLLLIDRDLLIGEHVCENGDCHIGLRAHHRVPPHDLSLSRVPVLRSARRAAVLVGFLDLHRRAVLPRHALHPIRSDLAGYSRRCWEKTRRVTYGNGSETPRSPSRTKWRRCLRTRQTARPF